MPIYLSASSIVDFLACSKRFYYRTTLKSESIANDDMLVGTIVHSAIEKFWDNESLALKEISDQLRFFKLPFSKVAKAQLSLENFFKNFAGLLSADDLIEYKFKLPLDKDVFLVGTMDRVSNKNIFDWKTTTTPPSDISKDVQFLIYNEAYRRLSGEVPIAVYYASLTTGKLIKLKHNPALTQILFSDIIPSMTQAIRQKIYYPSGIFTNNCHKCSFMELCYKEQGYELDYRKFSKK